MCKSVERIGIEIKFANLKKNTQCGLAKLENLFHSLVYVFLVNSLDNFKINNFLKKKLHNNSHYQK